MGGLRGAEKILDDFYFSIYWIFKHCLVEIFA